MARGKGKNTKEEIGHSDSMSVKFGSHSHRSQMEENISPTSLNVTAESSSKFKQVVNAYRCFVESDEHNEGHKITKRLSTR